MGFSTCRWIRLTFVFINENGDFSSPIFDTFFYFFLLVLIAFLSLIYFKCIIVNLFHKFTTHLTSFPVIRFILRDEWMRVLNENKKLLSIFSYRKSFGYLNSKNVKGFVWTKMIWVWWFCGHVNGIKFILGTHEFYGTLNEVSFRDSIVVYMLLFLVPQFIWFNGFFVKKAF